MENELATFVCGLISSNSLLIDSLSAFIAWKRKLLINYEKGIMMMPHTDHKWSACELYCNCTVHYPITYINVFDFEEYRRGIQFNKMHFGKSRNFISE